MERFELAEKALEFLSLAEQFEKADNFSQAIENYQKAAEYMQKSGLLKHRIEEIYRIIENLKKSLNMDLVNQQLERQDQIDQLQLQAFHSIETAKRLESKNEIEEAIQHYTSALISLKKAGWSEEQLKNLEIKRNHLLQRPERQHLKNGAASFEKKKPPIITLLYEPRVIFRDEGFLGEKAITKKVKSERLKTFETKRRREEEIQNRAFSHLDEAKKQEANEEYLKALLNYQKALELLNSIGWHHQTRNIKAIIINLKKQIQDQKKSAKLEQVEEKSTIEERGEPKIIQPEPMEELREYKVLELKKKREEVEQIQNKAFKLIDKANELEKAEELDEALTNLNEAIKLLKSIGWDDYLTPIITKINQIKDKKLTQERKRELEQKMKQVVEKAELEQVDLKEVEIAENLEDVDILTKKITQMVEKSKKDIMLREKQRRENVKAQAAQFSKSMGDLIKLKREFIEELKKAKMEEEKKLQQLEQEKEREKLDEIARMLDELNRKKQ
ncbi:MAG: hypothetical protein ACTSU4_03255 [Promethearchaeota archaeon]